MYVGIGRPTAGPVHTYNMYLVVGGGGLSFIVPLA